MSQDVYELFRVLAERQPEEVSKRCKVVFIPRREERGERYLVNLLNESYSVDLKKYEVREVVTEDLAEEKLTRLILKYLLMWSPTRKEWKWLSLSKSLKDTELISRLDRYVLRPLLQNFGYDPISFEGVCRSMGGTREKMGGISYSFDFFPDMRGGVQLWAGESYGYKLPSANVLFDDRALELYTRSELVDAAEVLVKVILKNKKKFQPK